MHESKHHATVSVAIETQDYLIHLICIIFSTGIAISNTEAYWVNIKTKTK